MSIYLKHPRVVELRVAMVHSLMVREFGIEKTTNLFKGICDTFGLNWTIIASIVNRKDKIYELNTTNKERFRQEMLYVGMLFGESKTTVGKKYLNLSKKSLYDYEKYDLNLNSYVNEDWLDGLNYTVAVCGMEAYRLEAIRLLDIIDTLHRLL